MNNTTGKIAMGEAEQLFWSLAQPRLQRNGVTRSTMMGLPRLRVHGALFASCDRKTGDLLVKLPAVRVDELLTAGRAVPFAPAGRRFREWTAIPAARSRSWKQLIQEAFDFVGDQL